MQNDTNTEKTPKSRKDLHLSRRFFHVSMGMTCGLIYMNYLSHEEAVHILGVATCIIYIVEQIRINYPEFKNIFTELGRQLLRAEEQLKESSSIPYLMGMLLTILTFPKYMSLVAIFTLAISDPLSAMIGIKFGKTKLKENRSLEGCLAFFSSTFIIHILVLNTFIDGTFKLIAISTISSLVVAWVDYLALKVDDNLTIPIITALNIWILTALF